MTRNDPQIKLRLPIELKELLEKAAKANRRSVNAEVLHRLHKSVISADETSLEVQEHSDGDWMQVPPIGEIREVIENRKILEQLGEVLRCQTEALRELTDSLTAIKKK